MNVKNAHLYLIMCLSCRRMVSPKRLWDERKEGRKVSSTERVESTRDASAKGRVGTIDAVR